MKYGKRPNWNKIGRLSGAAAGALATRIYVCKFCDTMQPGKPDMFKGCIGCQNVDFLSFQSKTEARRYGELRLREKVGRLEGLRCQVRYNLMAPDPAGTPVKVAEYVADFVYREDGQTIIEDVKPSAGIDPTAALKLRWMSAQGMPVRIVTEKGVIA